MKTLFVTGGAGFIGSALIRHLIRQTSYHVVNIDKLTYAGNLASLAAVAQSARYQFEQVDICASGQIAALFCKYQPEAIFHLAAESHVDRSIHQPVDFIQTNVVGTYNLLEAARHYYQQLSPAKRSQFRFIHISTDEVFGDLPSHREACSETSPYTPSSPYSASKASSDHLVRAWHRTYGLPVLLTHCSNNYGYFQFPEKLIPLAMLNALHGLPIPLYGSGMQIRDWIFVEDHIHALCRVLEAGNIGESYNISGNTQLTNLAVVQQICDLLTLAKKQAKLTAYQTYHPHIDDFRSLIHFVQDRPGHDNRYALSHHKITQTLGWQPQERFASGLQKTLDWYLHNTEWWQPLFQPKLSRLSIQ